HVTGKDGDRDIAAADFFTGYFTNALSSDEILTGVTLPALNGRTWVIRRSRSAKQLPGRWQ
ncbi:MAG: hypothetical protein V3U39_08780, partial [Acidimicrobiia bacterium]